MGLCLAAHYLENFICISQHDTQNCNPGCHYCACFFFSTDVGETHSVSCAIATRCIATEHTGQLLQNSSLQWQNEQQLIDFIIVTLTSTHTLAISFPLWPNLVCSHRIIGEYLCLDSNEETNEANKTNNSPATVFHKFDFKLQASVFLTLVADV